MEALLLVGYLHILYKAPHEWLKLSGLFLMFGGLIWSSRSTFDRYMQIENELASKRDQKHESEDRQKLK
jgi:hypothetical protein